ncbi:MAG: helix-turn-helix domain-containing protein [Candidatus Yanofskybacteria bacterium]|nr:helix-turn-helix domain-containing protein [Candidatus Yanofskybacteria bacterium]
MTKKKFLTLREAAKYLRVSERSLYRYISSGRLKATKVGYWRISESDLEAFIRSRSNIKKPKK